MPDAAHPADLTIEEQLRAAQGVLLLVAELFELYSFTPEGLPARLLRGRLGHRGRTLPAAGRGPRPARAQPPGENGQRRGSPDARGRAVPPRHLMNH